MKKYQAGIYRCVNVFKADRTLTAANRASMEYFNRNFKKLFQTGLNCTKQEHLLNKLELQLNCPVRFFLNKPIGAQ
jgi:hypothetical protein